MTSTLSISRIVRTTVNLNPSAAQEQNLSTLLVLDDNPVIDVVERYRPYTSASDVADDFGTASPFYYAAVVYFGQRPQPAQMMCGRWAKTASKGKLVCATLSVAAQALSSWTSITAGSFTYTKDAGGPTTVTALNFSGATTLNGVAAIIQAALTGVTVIYNANYQRFEFESGTTGAASSVSFLSAAGSGSDISSQIGGSSTSSGAYVVQGQALETAVTSAALFDSNYGQLWYGLVIPTASDADHLAVAAFIEATDTKHAYGVTTQEAGVLVKSDTSNIAYQLKQLGYNKTSVQYCSNNAYAVCSYLGRILPTDYQGNNTTITLMFKNEPGIVPETINTDQAYALQFFNCNAFVQYDNNVAIIQNGVQSSGVFTDIVFGTDWLAVDIQTAYFNMLYTSTTKIPQTDDGAHLGVAVCEQRCSQAKTNGLLAPGIWNQGGFGTLKEGDLLPKGFYVFSNPIDTQLQADRDARKAPLIQIAGKLAGAIQSADIQINVNR